MENEAKEHKERCSNSSLQYILNPEEEYVFIEGVNVQDLARNVAGSLKEKRVQDRNEDEISKPEAVFNVSEQF